jgi:hypothetical protein
MLCVVGLMLSLMLRSCAARCACIAELDCNLATRRWPCQQLSPPMCKFGNQATIGLHVLQPIGE